MKKSKLSDTKIPSYDPEIIEKDLKVCAVIAMPVLGATPLKT